MIGVAFNDLPPTPGRLLPQDSDLILDRMGALQLVAISCVDCHFDHVYPSPWSLQVFVEPKFGDTPQSDAADDFAISEIILDILGSILIFDPVTALKL